MKTNCTKNYKGLFQPLSANSALQVKVCMSISSASELKLVLLDQAPLQLEREGIKKREDGERGGGG